MKLSIIIPCYNESKDIAKNVDIVKKYLIDKNINHELILVNDGSKDNTKEIIESIPDVVAVSYEPNRGKGGAVKEGILNAIGDYVLFMDADLSTDISAIEKVIELAPDYDLILGSRHAKDSVIKKKQPALRVFIGWCCRLLVNLLFHTHLKDTQCGFKALKTDVAKKIVSKQLITNFAFDVEYIYIAKLNGLSMKELGIVWSDDRESTVSPFKSSVKFFKDLGAIRRNRKKYYFSEEAANKDVSKFPIVLMSLLLFFIILFFVIFLLIRGCSGNDINTINSEEFNTKLISIVKNQMSLDSFADDNLNKVAAISYVDNYPTSFSLNIVATSDTNIYYYSLNNYNYPSDHSNYDNFAKYLLTNTTDSIVGVTELSFLPLVNENVNSTKAAKYVVSKNNSEQKYVSGFYLENNTYSVFIKKEIVADNDPFSEPNQQINADSPIFSYYQFLNQ